jgi:hypothetical protein
MMEHPWIVFDDDATIRCADEAGAKECAENRAKAKPGRKSFVAAVVGFVEFESPLVLPNGRKASANQ